MTTTAYSILNPLISCYLGTNWGHRQAAETGYIMAMLDVARLHWPHLDDSDLSERVGNLIEDARIAQAG